MNFVTVGDDKYFLLLRENCTQIRSCYPNAPILIYDFGLSASHRTELTQSFQPIDVVDWQARLDSIPGAWDDMPEAQKRKLALAFNARQTGLQKRLRKAIFKRFPDSSFAKAMQRRALRFENLLIQKIACMRDASERVGADRFVFLDADAMLFKPIDDAFSEMDDIAITLIPTPSWQHNACFVVNSGVIFFGADNQARVSFLDAWWDAALNNYEWLREQTALARMIERQADRQEFRVGNRLRIDCSGVPVRIRFIACEEYNFFEMENVDPRDFPDSRIYHFTGRSQQPKQFHEIMTYLRANKAAGGKDAS